jgi:hypothetical protein
LVEVYRGWFFDGDQIAVERTEALRQLANSTSWNPSQIGEAHLRILATRAGEKEYARLLAGHKVDSDQDS